MSQRSAARRDAAPAAGGDERSRRARDADSGRRVPRLLPLDERELLAGADDAVPWLLHELLPVEGVTMFHGRPRSFKSYAALDVALALALGRPAFGSDRFAPEQGPAHVLYISGEDGRRLIAARVRLLLSGYGVPDAGGRLHVLAVPGIALEDDPSNRRDVLDAVRHLRALAVVLDSGRSLFPGVDGGPKDGAPFAAFVRTVLTETPARAVLVNHHDVRPSSSPGPRRSGGERASGGVMLSVADCPVGFVSAGKRAASVTPTQYKPTADPPPFRLVFDSESAPGEDFRGYVRTRTELVAGDVGSTDDGDGGATMQARALDTVTANPGLSGRKVAELVEARPAAVGPALEALRRQSLVEVKAGPRGAQFWFPRPPMGSDSE